MKKSLRYLPLLTLLFFVQSNWAGSLIQQQGQLSKSNFHYSKDLSIVTGFQSGRENLAELGIAIKNDMIAHHFYTSILAVSNEFRYTDNFVWGFKLGGWIGGGAGTNLGINLINYTDFQESAIRFRPEIGIGFGKFRMYYGYNVALINKRFSGINDHLFGVNILLDIKNLKTSKTPFTRQSLE